MRLALALSKTYNIISTPTILVVYYFLQLFILIELYPNCFEPHMLQD